LKPDAVNLGVAAIGFEVCANVTISVLPCDFAETDASALF
jgi:hypothetical protein